MKRLLPIFLVGATANCFAAIGVGFSEATPEGDLYVHTSAAVEPSTPIQIKLGIDRGADCCRQYFGRDFQKVDPVDAVMGNQEVVRYRLAKPDAAPPETRSIGIAVIDATRAANKGDDVVATAAGRRYVVKSCLGSEGVNLTLLRNGRVKDRLYYGLGYDVAPTCGKTLKQ